jgi:hypothetical protein
MPQLESAIESKNYELHKIRAKMTAAAKKKIIFARPFSLLRARR